MKIKEAKYKVGQKVWVVCSNEVAEKVIMGCFYTFDVYNPYGRILYFLRPVQRHHMFNLPSLRKLGKTDGMPERLIYSTKEELVASIIGKV